MDVKRLRNLYETNEIARQILDNFAGRQRNRVETPVRVVREALRRDGIQVLSNDVRSVFREFEGAGCGRLVVGRRGHESRFFWEVELIAAARVAQCAEETAPEIPEEPEIDDPDSDLISFGLRLRHNLTVQIELPADLTVTEADRLAHFMKSLPLEEP